MIYIVDLDYFEGASLEEELVGGRGCKRRRRRKCRRRRRKCRRRCARKCRRRCRRRRKCGKR